MKPTHKDLRRLGISFVAEAAEIREYVLKRNSLKILLSPNANARSAVVLQHIHVGSRCEGAGTTGFAHLLEHMLFKGTDEHNRDKGNSYDEFIKAHGNMSNATTWYDTTNFFAKVPSHAVRELIAHEADRLRHAHITDQDLKSEMPAVVKELELGENEPRELLGKLMWALAFTEHPYKVDTLGSRSDVIMVTAAALKERFYERFYWPNNVTLIVCGNIDELETLGWIAESYGSIPPSPLPVPRTFTVEPAQHGERRGVIHLPGDLSRVAMAFHVPGADHDDHLPLKVLSEILGGNASSRLYRKLVDSGLAAGAEAFIIDTRDPGLFEVRVTAAPGVKPERLEKLVLKEIERLKKRPISASDLKRTKSLNRTGTLMARADEMDRAHQISTNEGAVDWLWGAQYDDNYDKVSRDDVLRVANQYLQPDNRTVGYFLPTGEVEEQTEEQAPPSVVDDEIKSPTFDKTVLYPLLESKSGPTLAQLVQTVTLPNGLTLLLAPTQSESESALGFSLLVNAGEMRADKNKRLVSHFASALLMRGSARFSRRRVYDLASETLSNLNWSITPGGAQLQTLVAPNHVPILLDLVCDALLQPLFAQEELDLFKTQVNAGLQQQSVDPQTQAAIAVAQALYRPDSPWFADSVASSQAQMAQIGVGDLTAFHKNAFGPKGAVMALVGKFDPAQMRRLIEAKFGAWQGGQAPVTELQAGALNARGMRKSVFIAGKDAIAVRVGLPVAVSKHSPDYLAALLANNALGGDTMASRLGNEIREKRGLTYGVNSYFSDRHYSGAPWLIDMATDAQKLERALTLIGKIMTCYATDGIGDNELHMEKSTLLNSFALGLDGALQLAVGICEVQYYGLGLQYLDQFETAVKAVTKDQVNTAIRTYFRMDNAVTAVAGTLAEGK